MSRVVRSYSPEFKRSVCERMASAANVQELARELGLRRATLYLWRSRYLSHGTAGLRGRGRAARVAEAAAAATPREPEAWERIAELERKIGQQALELDFFRAALQRVGAARRSTGGPGETTSTR